VVTGVPKLIDFLKQAFGAQEHGERHSRPDGTVMHAEVLIGDSYLMLGEATDQYPPMPGCFYLYVPDVDAVYRRAMEAGATLISAPEDKPYGDRNAGVRDSSGNQWWIATHIEDVSEEELRRRMS
jgi:PhnB protein